LATLTVVVSLLSVVFVVVENRIEKLYPIVIVHAAKEAILVSPGMRSFWFELE